MNQQRNSQLDGLPLATALALCAGLLLWIGRDNGERVVADEVYAAAPPTERTRALPSDVTPQTPFGTRSIDELLEGVFDPPVLRREVQVSTPERRAPPPDDGRPVVADSEQPRWVALGDAQGRVLAEGRMLGEVPDGPWLFRAAGGARLAAGSFAAGVPDGPWQSWHADGSPRESLEYDQGVPEGWRVEWWPNGTKALEGLYLAGERSGDWNTWHESGALRSTGGYDDGLREGPWMEWHANGQVRSAAAYRNGRRDGAFRAWHANGAVAETGEFVDGLREGLWGFFTPDGKRERRSGIYVAGERQRE